MSACWHWAGRSRMGFFGKVEGTGSPSKRPAQVCVAATSSAEFLAALSNEAAGLADPATHPAPAQPADATTPELRFGDLTRSSSASRPLGQHRQHRQLPGSLHQHRFHCLGAGNNNFNCACSSISKFAFLLPVAHFLSSAILLHLRLCRNRQQLFATPTPRPRSLLHFCIVAIFVI